MARKLALHDRLAQEPQLRSACTPNEILLAQEQLKECELLLTQTNIQAQHR
jgi:hypothetical protein